ncbi:hypothetical protein K450DRAFT_229788 [Umbelopsis ramanniana AG]|uniref:AD domain-containing protein n=1 Tax=Umbelopsis ramanniana AG TaxID=1314678 RepID=A0AAD5EDH6_UMBRA|nr:uncharacterized protein K450DRAFT_229788 [Umbelopsis ramanniana AG]KAI8581901.1 hypothetical protein K450DRAFT_229788 [Umbelopsis ramanniana AG]
MNPVKGEENTMAPTSTTLSTPGSLIAGNKRLDSFIDSEIKIRTVDNEEISGKLFTVDPITSCLALNCQKVSLNGQPSQKYGFRIIKISHIKELISFEPKKPNDRKKPVEPTKDSIETVYAQASSAPRKVYIDQINQREAEAIKLASQQAARIGVGVTKDAQAIFDALSKTLPCRWAKDSIVVMDEVIISPPYNEENCRANASSTASLTRVKKVLEGEKKRLGAISK